MFVALFTSQQTMAQDVIYKANLVDEFKNTWTQEGDNANTDLWYISDEYVQAYGYMASSDCVSYLVSPKITLDASGNNVTFNHKGWYFGTISEEAQLVIRETGGNWVTIKGVQYPEEGNYKEINAGTLEVPAEFNGKEVQFAFQYKYNSNTIGTWSIRDITVTKAAGGNPEEELAIGQIYEESFYLGYEAAGYTIEGEQGEVDAGMPLWYNSDGYVTAFAYSRIGYRKNIESFLVSPEITLYKENTAGFTHKAYYFENKIGNYVSFWVREVGGEWIQLNGMETGDDSFDIYTGAMSVPAELDGKTVQFGFRYTAESSEKAGMWMIKDFVVKGLMPKKAEAELSYDVTEYSYILGGEEEFKAPVLNNPNGLKVQYTSSNPTVASIDENGNLTIEGQGTTEIIAISKETKDFCAGKASYTLNIVDETIIFSANFFSDMCGFKQECETSDVEVFVLGYYGSLIADAYYKISSMTTFYMVSPEITLDAVGNTVTMEHQTFYFADVKKEAQLVIREVGSAEWENIDLVYPEGEEICNTGKMEVPAKYNGKNVQFAFKYTADGQAVCGSWTIKNFTVNRADVPTSIEGVNAEMQNGKIYDLQGREVNKAANGIFIINGKKVIVK